MNAQAGISLSIFLILRFVNCIMFNQIGQQVGSDLIIPAPRYDEVGVAFGRFHEGFMGGPNRSKIAVDGIIVTNAALMDVPIQATNQADISISVHEDLEIQNLSQLWYRQHQDTLQQNHRLGSQRESRAAPGILAELISRYIYDRLLSHLGQMGYQQLAVKSIRMVHVHLLTFFQGQVRLVQVVPVLGYISYILFPSFSAIERATVVFPAPEPPAIPTTSMNLSLFSYVQYLFSPFYQNAKPGVYEPTNALDPAVDHC